MYTFSFKIVIYGTTNLIYIEQIYTTWIGRAEAVIKSYKTAALGYIYVNNDMRSDYTVTKTNVLKISSSWSFFHSPRLKGSIPITLSHSKAAIVWQAIINLELDRKCRNTKLVSKMLSYGTHSKLLHYSLLHYHYKTNLWK